MILESKRLYFRHFVPQDLADIFALYRDPEIRRYFPEGTLTLEETREELDWFLNGHPEYPKLGLWATVLKDTDQFSGRCGLLPWTIEGRAEVEVAYLISKDHWGRGYGTEAAGAIMNYAFEQLDISRLICLIDRNNMASINVATNIGMHFEMEGTDDLGPYWLYSKENSFYQGDPDGAQTDY